MAESGIKLDSGKDPWHLLAWDAIREVVRVLRFGAYVKPNARGPGLDGYGERNWEKGLAYSRVFSATQRHLHAFFVDGETKDPETGLHPLAHAMCELMFMLAFCLRGRHDLDDRPCERPAAFAVLRRNAIPLQPAPAVPTDRERLAAFIGVDPEIGSIRAWEMYLEAHEPTMAQMYAFLGSPFMATREAFIDVWEGRRHLLSKAKAAAPAAPPATANGSHEPGL